MRCRLVPGIFCILLGITSPASAQTPTTYTWTGSSGGAWLNDANWSSTPEGFYPGQIAAGSATDGTTTDVAQFTTALTAAYNIGINMNTAGSALELATFRFAPTSGDFAFTLGSSNTTLNSFGVLRLNGSTVAGVNNVILSHERAVGVNSQLIIRSLNGGSQQMDIRLSGLQTQNVVYANLVTNQTLLLSRVLEGLTGSSLQAYNGTLILANSNTYTGGTSTTNNGRLWISHELALGTGALTLGDQTGTSATAPGLGLRFQSASTNRIANNIALGTLSTTIATLVQTNATTGVEVELAGVLSGGASGQTFTFTSGDSLQSGTIKLSGTNTFTGNVSLAFGTLAITSDASLGNAANGLTLTSAANGNLGGIRFDAADITLASTRAITLGAATFEDAFRTNGFDATIAGTISGAGIFVKQGAGTLKLTGSANTLTSFRISGGTLDLDYTTNNDNKVASTATGIIVNGTLRMTANAAGSTQSLGVANSVTIVGGAYITAISNGGTGATLNLGAIDRRVFASATGSHLALGTVNFTLPTIGNITTTNANLYGTLFSGYATVGGTDFATITAGNIAAFTAYTNDVFTAGTNTNVTTSTTTTLAGINSLRFNTPTATTLTLSGTNTITSNALLVGSGVGANKTIITGGTLQGAAVVSAQSGQIIVQQFNTAETLEISSTIANGATFLLSGVSNTAGANSITGGGIGNQLAQFFLITSGTITVPANTYVTTFASTTLSTVNISNSITAANTSQTVNITPANGLSKSGPGTLILSGNNTFSGGISINEGVLSVSNIASGGNLGTDVSFYTRPIFLAGTLSYTGASDSMPVGRSIILRGDGSGARAAAIEVTNAATNLTLLSSVSTATLSSDVSSTLVKRGAGTLTFSPTSANTFVGGITVSNGTIATGLGNNTAALSVNGGFGAMSGTITLGDADTPGSATLALLTNPTTLNVLTRNQIIVTGNGATRTIGTASGTTSGVIAEFAGQITLKGDVTLQSGHANDRTLFSNRITGTGNVNITRLGGTTGTVSFGVSTLATTVGLAQDNPSMANDFVGNINIASGAILQIFTASSGQIDLDTYIPNTANIVFADNTATFQTSTFSTSTAGQFERLNALVSTVAGAGIITSVNGTNRFDLYIGSGNGSGTFSGIISQLRFAIVKEGTGTQTFEGTSASTYSNGTVINAGRIQINTTAGSPLGTGTVVVNSGGTLGGAGTLSGGALSIASGGTLAPGGVSTVGTLNFNATTSTVVLASGGIFAARVDAVGANDRLNLTGVAAATRLTVNNSTLSLTFDPSYTPTGSELFFIGVQSGTAAVSGTFSGLAEGATVTTISGVDFKISYAGNFTTLANDLSGNDILIYGSGAPVPEPTTVLGLCAVGAGLVGGWRRRRATRTI